MMSVENLNRDMSNRNLFFVLILVAGVGGIIFSSDLVLGLGCCATTNDDLVCESVEQSECRVGSEFADKALCGTTSFCNKGCCFDGKGSFDKGVTKFSCEAREEKWDDDEFCNIEGSQMGCCTILGESSFENKAYCGYRASLIGGGEHDFKEGMSEEQCVLGFTTSKQEAACVLKDKGCTHVTEEACINLGGEYRGGLLCTAESLETNCEMTEETKCDAKKNGVYFVDSCGNLANIYDSSKVKDGRYWTEIVDREKSCGADESINSSSCGNCEVTKSVCSSAIEDKFKVEFGNSFCKDTSCDFKGERYLNGESWCDFDGKIGDGDDVVGSRHWLYRCNQGFVDSKQEGKDMREDICVEKVVKDGDLELRSAKFVANDALTCLSYNLLVENSEEREDNLKKCQENEFCMVQRTEVSSYFKFDMCVPKYPVGYKLGDEASLTEAEDACGVIDVKCPVVQEKTEFAKWKVVKNGECLEEEFTQKMNDVCRKIGDCGLEVNIAGNYTENYEVVGAPNPGQPLIEEIKELSSYKSGQSVNFSSTFIPDRTILSFGTSGKKWYEQFNFKKTLLVDFIGPIIGRGKVRYKHVTFTCLPWKAPTGKGNCDACNGDPFKPCSQYRCSSLGTHCTLINEDSVLPICIYDNKNDPLSPNIKYGEAGEGEKYVEVSSSEFKILRSDDSCIDAGEDIALNIVTDELAKCRFSYDLATPEYKDMKEFFEEDGYSLNHTATIAFGDLSDGESKGLDVKYENKVYVMCSDFHDNPSIKPYVVDVCVNEEKDTHPPRLKKFLPVDGSLVGFEVTKKNVSLYVNTYATCKWDSEDKNYTEMKNEMSCFDFGNDHICNSELPITGTENKFYFKCLDQPWLEDVKRSEDRNENKEGIKYILKRPIEKIKIDSIIPFEDFDIATPQVTKEIRVKTSGGGANHKCYYSFEDTTLKNPMEFTGKIGEHKQSRIVFDSGINFIYVRCVDETGDFAEEFSRFEITQDTSVPLISRIWQTAGNLEVVTSEKAECRYSLESCLFKWEEGKEIGKETSHVFSAVRGSKYYVKCKDSFENIPYGCSAVVTAI